MTSLAFYEKKVRTAFRFLDVGHDGYVTRADLEDVAIRLGAVNKLTPEEMASLDKEWTKWVDSLFPTKADVGITEDEFYQLNNNFRQTHSLEVKLANEKTYGALFDAIDLNKDGIISREELGVYYGAYGVTNRQFVERVFRELDQDEDGYITKNEFVTAWVEYWTNLDPTSGYEFMYDISAFC